MPASKVRFHFLQGKESWEMEPPAKVETANQKKDEGNALFKQAK